MCNVCGCGEGETRIDGQLPHNHHHDRGHDHHHDHPHDHHHGHGPGADSPHSGNLDYGSGPARAHAPGMSQSRMVQIEKNVLEKNDEYAAANRQWLADRGAVALNLVSSPGSGKTTLLTRTVADLSERYGIGVIEGDQQTRNDADKLEALGVPTVQINTGKGCHLDGHMVGHALEQMDGAEQGLVFIENVGNLVCPSAFDLGEEAKVVILSVTEGEDKPVKYPDMFHRADLMLLNKVDLLPHLDFDTEQCLAHAREVNPGIEAISVSATTGEGLDQWYQWLTRRRDERLERLAADLEGRAARLRASLASD